MNFQKISLIIFEGRKAASKHEMGIYEDLDVVYDLKMLDKEGEIQTKYRKKLSESIQ